MMWNWIRLSSLLLVIAACEFPRPADVAPGSCKLDDDCDGSTPYCAGGTCGACAVSETCPTARPVCDEVSHDCRTCVKDSECDSGACDIAAGTCVEQGAILYASPAGGGADSCTRANPCSLRHAASLVDAAHSYIVLLPGIHTSTPWFEGKRATLCGNGATLEIQFGGIWLHSNSRIELRNLSFSWRSGYDGDRAYAIRYDNSELVLENVHIKIDLPERINGIDGLSSDAAPAKLTIRNSHFIHAPLRIEGYFAIDSSTIVSGRGIEASRPIAGMSSTISNSLLVVPPGEGAITIYSPPQHFAAYRNNTIVGGIITCGDEAGVERFESNIIYKSDLSQVNNNCYFENNLIVPSANVSGMENISGDPMFVDEANNDFHLKPGSPAIDAADPSDDAKTGHDLDAKPRPQGARFDLGAYEYVP